MDRRLSAAIVLLALSLVSCGGVGKSVDTLTEGTIVLHSPPRTSKSSRVTLAATTIIFTTATDEPEGQPDQGLQVTAGILEGDAPPLRSMTQLAKGTNKPAARILDPTSFARLWQSVDAAGLFKLPRYPGGRPPEDQEYILVKKDGQRQIYTRPRPGSSPADEDATRLLRYWRDSKMAIVSFLNS